MPGSRDPLDIFGTGGLKNRASSMTEETFDGTLRRNWIKWLKIVVLANFEVGRRTISKL